MSEATAIGDTAKTLKRIYFKMPHGVVQDTRVPAEALAQLALRKSFADDRKAYDLRPHTAKKLLGIGGDRFHTNNRRAIALGYLQREQQRVNDGPFAGDFARVAEKIDLGDGHYTIWRRDIFDRVKEGCERARSREVAQRPTRGLEAKACALLFYIHSHAHSFKLSSPQICQRFGWSDATLWRIARPLRAARLLPPKGYARLHLPDAQRPDALHPDAQLSQQPGAQDFHRPDTQDPATPIHEPSKVTYHQETQHQVTQQGNPLRIISSVSRVRAIEEAEGDDVAALRTLQQIVERITSADRFHQLHQRLFTEARLQQLMSLLTKRGDAVVELMVRTLQSGDTCDASRIISWHYFEMAFRNKEAAFDRERAMFARRRAEKGPETISSVELGKPRFVQLAAGAKHPQRTTPARERVMNVAADGRIWEINELAAEANCSTGVIEGLILAGCLTDYRDD